MKIYITYKEFSLHNLHQTFKNKLKHDHSMKCTTFYFNDYIILKSKPGVLVKVYIMSI